MEKVMITIMAWDIEAFRAKGEEIRDETNRSF